MATFFLVLKQMNLQEKWIHWCISTPFRIKINGELTESFSSSGGLRQGDPLSPYLFLIVSEGLSAILKEAKEQRHFSGIRVCKQAPAISHLFFADDAVIFCTASLQEVQLIWECLKSGTWSIHGKVKPYHVEGEKSSLRLWYNQFLFIT